MALKQFNPVTPSLRGTVLIDRSELWKGKPVKALTEGKIDTGGRNNHGRITCRFRGGGHKQAYRVRRFQAAQVRRGGDGGAAGIRPEPHGVHRADQVCRTASCPTSWRRSGCARATRWSPAQRADIKPGNAMPLAAIPVGTIVHNVEMKQGAGGKIARAAGTYAQLVGKDAGYAQIKLKSGELRAGAGRVHGDGRRGVATPTT